MTREEISAVIESVGIPSAFGHFNKEDVPAGQPYICFATVTREDFYADDAVLVKIAALRVELYAVVPDFALEDRLEAALAGAGLDCDKDGPDYIAEEKLYLTTFETEVILNA